MSLPTGRVRTGVEGSPVSRARLQLTQESVHVNGLTLAYLHGGNEQDPLVICVHGFPDSPATFKHLAPELVRSGFRVVAPWLRGYPPSQVVAGPYQVAALARDVIALAEALSPNRAAFLVGHDWGGMACYGAATLDPTRWERAAVLSVPPTRVFRSFLARDWDQQRASWYQFFFQRESLADAAVSAADFAFIERLWESWSPGWAVDPEILDAAKSTLREGFPAALNFYRDTWQVERQDPQLADDQRRIIDGPITVPTMVLHGVQDGCILPGAFADAAQHFTGGHTIEAVKGVGHFLHLESPQVVNDKILSFFRQA